MLGIRTKISKFLYQRKFHKNKLQLDIKSKNILITGGNSGIGLALTKNLLALNNKVISTYREDGQNLKAINDINLSIIKLDQSDINNFNDFEKKIEDASIDIIFNCAGDFGGSFEEQEVETRVVDVQIIVDYAKLEEDVNKRTDQLLKNDNS